MTGMFGWLYASSIPSNIRNVMCTMYEYVCVCVCYCVRNEQLQL